MAFYSILLFTRICTVIFSNITTKKWLSILISRFTNRIVIVISIWIIFILALPCFRFSGTRLFLKCVWSLEISTFLLLRIFSEMRTSSTMWWQFCWIWFHIMNNIFIIILGNGCNDFFQRLFLSLILFFQLWIIRRKQWIGISRLLKKCILIILIVIQTNLLS